MPAARRSSTPDDGALRQDAEKLYDALSELVRVYQFRDRDLICCHDISVTQCYALEALVARDGLSLNELAAALYLEKSTASRVVGALERKGYVSRVPHPGDGRSIQLTATSEGKHLHDRIRQELIAEEMELLQDIDPRVRSAAADLLRRLAKAADGRVLRGRSEKPDSCGTACC